MISQDVTYLEELRLNKHRRAAAAEAAAVAKNHAADAAVSESEEETPAVPPPPQLSTSALPGPGNMVHREQLAAVAAEAVQGALTANWKRAVAWWPLLELVGVFAYDGAVVAWWLAWRLPQVMRISVYLTHDRHRHNQGWLARASSIYSVVGFLNFMLPGPTGDGCGATFPAGDGSAD